MEKFKSGLSVGYQKKQEASKKTGPGPFTDKELKSMQFHFDRLVDAKNQRQQNRPEFDDLDYETDYAQNLLVKNSYLRKKRNDDEVRVNTGTAEKKVESVLNELLSYNFQPEVLVFDKEDRKLTELSADFTDLVNRTNEQERDDDFWIEAFLELLCQRAVFIKELYDERTYTGRNFKEEKMGQCRKVLLDGRQVYLGDINLPARLFQQQPYIVEYNRLQYVEAETMFSDLPNWDKVKPGSPSNDWYGGFYNFRLNPIRNNEVEVITYKSFPDNEYQIYINGVPMLPFDTELPWEWDGYDIDMFILKPVSTTLAYGRSLLSSTKFLQALSDETVRLMIRKFRQALEPPSGTLTGKVYSKDIWSPGAITQGVTRETFSKLIDHDGVTSSEFAMLDLITKKTEEFIGRGDLQQGIVGKKLTATQTMELQKQAIKNLGLAVMGAMRMKRNMTYLRIYNGLQNFTKPNGKEEDPLTGKLVNKYRQFSIQDATFEDQKQGTKLIKFTDQTLPPEEQKNLMNWEDQQAELGRPTRIKLINVKELRKFPLYWYVVVTSKEKDSTALQRAQFKEMLQDSMAVSQIAQKPLNGDKLVDSFERVWKEKDLFKQPAQQMGQMGPQGQLPQGGQGTQQGANDILNQLKQMGGAGGPQQPSVNQMVQQP